MRSTWAPSKRARGRSWPRISKVPLLIVCVCVCACMSVCGCLCIFFILPGFGESLPNDKVMKYISDSVLEKCVDTWGEALLTLKRSCMQDMEDMDMSTHLETVRNGSMPDMDILKTLRRSSTGVALCSNFKHLHQALSVSHIR